MKAWRTTGIFLRVTYGTGGTARKDQQGLPAPPPQKPYGGDAPL